MDDIKTRLKAMFMSRTQSIYLVNLFIECVVGGAFEATWAFQQNALGTRVYSTTMILSCIIGCIYAYMSTDVKKKRWIFRHFKVIDIGETIFFTCTELTFLTIYIVGGYDPIKDMNRVLWLFFYWTMFYRFVTAIICTILPGIGDVYEQSLYKNQIDYQNHSNAEQLMCSTGAIFGAFISLMIGDFIKYHPWLIFTLVIMDWVGLWSRWQFYFNKENYAIIKRNFAKDAGNWKRKQTQSKSE